MRGSIRKKGNGRYYVVTNHTDPATGRKHQKSHGGYGTKKEAEARLREVLTAMDRGTFIEPSKITLGQYLVDEWLPLKRDVLKRSTFASYQDKILNYVVPRIGHVPLQKVTPGVLRGFYTELATDGRRNGPGGGLAPRTVRYTHTLVRSALQQAMEDHLIPTNPAATKRARPPKGPGRKEMKTWTADELGRFLDTAADHRLAGAFELAANTGMRRGEVLGLRWSDVDLDAAQIVVRQGLVSVGYELFIEQPKTENSVRSFSIDPGTVDALRAHRRRQAEERLAFGPGYADTDLVFTEADGSMVRPDRLSQAWESLLRKSKLRRIRFHDLRHTHATLALAAGVPPKIVSARLGHKSVAFTLDVYTHAIPAMDADAANLIAGLVNRNRTTG